MEIYNAEKLSAKPVYHPSFISLGALPSGGVEVIAVDEDGNHIASLIGIFKFGKTVMYHHAERALRGYDLHNELCFGEEGELQTHK